MNQMVMPHPVGASSSASQGPPKKEEELEDWGVHLLALAPQGLLVSSLQSKLVQAKRERKLAYHPGTEISIRRVLSKVAEEAGPNKLKLRSTMLDRASLQWPHYSAAQRATLELIRNPSGAKEEEDDADSDSDDDRPLAEQVARLQQQEQPPAKRAKSEATPAAAAAPAAVRAASAPAAAAQAPAASTKAAEPAAAPEPAAAKEDEEEAEVERPPVPLTFAELRDGLTITDDSHCEACKKHFATSYERYLTLDADLGENASEFEALNREFERSRGEAQVALVTKMKRLWAQRRPQIDNKNAEYRRLHVELKRLKEAVNAWCAAQ